MALRCLCCDKLDGRFVCGSCGNQQLATFKVGGAAKGLHSALAKAIEGQAAACAARRRVALLRQHVQHAKVRVRALRSRTELESKQVSERQQDLALRRRQLQKQVSSLQPRVSWRQFWADPRPDHHKLPAFHPLREFSVLAATLAAERRQRCLELMHCFPVLSTHLPRDVQKTWWVHVLRGLQVYLDLALPFPPEVPPSEALRHPLQPGTPHPEHRTLRSGQSPRDVSGRFLSLLQGNVGTLARQNGVSPCGDCLHTLRAVVNGPHFGCLTPPPVVAGPDADEWTLVDVLPDEVGEPEKAEG